MQVQPSGKGSGASCFTFLQSLFHELFPSSSDLVCLPVIWLTDDSLRLLLSLMLTLLLSQTQLDAGPSRATLSFPNSSPVKTDVSGSSLGDCFKLAANRGGGGVEVWKGARIWAVTSSIWSGGFMLARSALIRA